MLTSYLKKLVIGENLTPQECTDAFETILKLESPIQIAAFLMLMRAKGETVDELSAFVKAAQQHQVNVKTNVDVVDIVGTGGDMASTANISTGASILIASCGVPVLKHGNRAVSSQSGAADVLEALGLTLEQTPEQVALSVHKAGIGFCFSPSFHPAFLALRPIRSQLKMPTFFNLLGPLLNPGNASYRIIGVYNHALQPLFADILVQMGIKRGMVVHGNGLDELNCLGPCDVIEVNGTSQKKYQIDPEALGLPRCDLRDLVGGDAKHNADLILRVVDNQQSHLANTMMLNAAAAVYIYGKAASLEEAVSLVKENIANGHAKEVLKQFIRSSHE